MIGIEFTPDSVCLDCGATRGEHTGPHRECPNMELEARLDRALEDTDVDGHPKSIWALQEAEIVRLRSELGMMRARLSEAIEQDYCTLRGEALEKKEGGLMSDDMRRFYVTELQCANTELVEANRALKLRIGELQEKLDATSCQACEAGEDAARSFCSECGETLI